ncbi:MAG: DUF421 domain-containing protein [Bacillota bacterium]
MVTTTLLKTVLSFGTLWVLARLLGKKQIGHLTLFDYMTGITLGAIAASLIIEREYLGPLVGMIAWTALALLMHFLDMKGRTMHRILDDKPSILIRNGRVDERELNRVQLNIEELMSMLRQAGYFHVAEVEFALLEPDGKLSVLPKSQYRPLQPRDLHVPTEYQGLLIQVMQEGRAIEHGLRQAGLAEDWLQAELARQRVMPEEVFAAWLDSRGKLVVDRYDTPH